MGAGRTTQCGDGHADPEHDRRNDVRHREEIGLEVADEEAALARLVQDPDDDQCDPRNLSPDDQRVERSPAGLTGAQADQDGAENDRAQRG